jgi:acetolactate synthase-1/2/3 large subunit
MAPQSGGRLLVDCLIAHEVPLMTCVPGESFLAILDAIYELKKLPHDSLPRLITARHEAAAANMAEAAGKLTGRAAVCFVTRGPGATHASIAVHTAYQDGTPMLLVVGQVSRSALGRQAFQEMDYSTVFGSSAKSIIEIHSADRIPEHVARAIHTARSGRPGPVILVVPEDVLSELTSAQVILAPTVKQPIAPNEQIQDVLELLHKAKRPILIVGGGGWDQSAADLITNLAERHQLPIATAFRWQDAVDNRSHSYVGYLGLGCSPQLRQRVAEADLLLVLGPRLDDPTTNGFEFSPAEGNLRVLVMVNQDVEELCRTVIPDIAVHTGIVGFLKAVNEYKLSDNPSRADWTKTLRQEFETFSIPPSVSSNVDMALIVQHVRATLPDDAIVTTGAGNYTVWIQRFFQFRRFHTQLAPRNGAMGYGFPAALAAAALQPRVKTIAFAGDGCLLMSGSELATAVQENLNVVLIVVNNGMFGTIRMHQEIHYPGRTIATNLHNPNFASYAESFGALGLVVRRTEDFAAAFSEALKTEGPVLIEIHTDPQQLTPTLRLDK